jgi:hypothetical protein
MNIKVKDPESEIFKIADENKDIILKIEYGDAQPGQASIVKLSSPTLSILITQTKDANSEDEFEDEFNLGMAKNIKNQILFVNTFLGDSSPITNKVSATYTFIISNSEGNFPQNLAIEFAPYWWSSHPGLTYDDYYEKTGFGEAIIETLSFSIGGKDTPIQQGEEEVDGTTLGLGLRFNLLAGQKNPALTDLEPNLERELKDLRRQYRINNNYTVFATYGKTFENSFEGDEDLVTLFGLKIGAGKNQVTQELLPSLTP